MENYYCTKCGASLNEQDGFDENDGVWTCLECGAELYDENMYDGDLYPDVIWYCDDCGAVLNKQSGFSDYYYLWTCSKCGYTNTISEDEIYESEEDYQRSKNKDIDNEYAIDDDDDDNNDDNDYDYDDDGDDNDEDDDNNDNDQFASSTNWELEVEHALSSTRGKRIKAFIFNKKKITIEYDSSELIGMNYRDVMLLLTKVGFKNVRANVLKDLYVDNSQKIYDTDNVTISGANHFNKNDLFPYNVDIIVSYHEKKEFIFPYSSKSVKKYNFKNLKEDLQRIGFTNIYEEAVHDLITGWIKADGSVDEVSIAGNNKFNDKIKYPYDEEIVIKYHTFKRK